MPSSPIPIDIGISHWFSGSGHTVRQIDLLAAGAPTWGQLGMLVAAIVATCLLLTWLDRRYRRNRRVVPMQSDDVAVPCPHCGSQYTQPHRSFEDRCCERCGHRFSLKG